MTRNDDDKHHNNDGNNSNNQLTPSSATSNNILSLIDSFIEQIFHMRRTLDVISISAIILACLAIALSIFLLRHPSFFAVLEIENEFGLVLGILLGAIIIISAIWIVAGIKQYRSISSWSKRYNDYVKHKEALDRKLALQQYDDNGDPSLGGS
ncbi:MAG: hypothetical protein ACJ71K_03055 [Nitrososphaeraceae archaeon]|jgi:hypothetical protein